ncbi:MAG TPA: LCP family protein [Gaiellaceae bacterium]|nr:LCP family protein [Gaiellaceae bacterium]
MASKDKPYRVYRGGRAKGPVPKEPAQGARRGGGGRGRPPDGQDPYGRRQPRRPRKGGARRVLRIVAVVVLVLVLLTVVWAFLGYLALRSGVKEANERLDSRAYAALAPQRGLLLTNPSTILVLGTDEGPNRQGPFRSDAIMIVRTDPDENRIALLSIPRDLRVTIPGRGTDKVNAAHAYGGPTLAVRTVEALTGLEINHVVVVNFDRFREVIDALGGITVNVPRRVLSNKFDCPRSTPAECDRWPGWRFKKGPQEMNGRRALVYSRVRQNQLDPSENDITRGERQQAVLQATADEITSFGTFLRMPFIGDDLVEPLATDLSTNQLLQLGWVKRRTPESGTLRCRLGGTIADIDGQSFILGSEENVSVIAMVRGDSAPQPPRPGSGEFGPGCRVGRSG